MLGLSANVIGDSYISYSRYKANGIDVLENASVEDWLLNIMNCKYLVTDSFHGACFAIIFHKPFTLIVNKYRGRTRIDTLKALFNIEDRIIEEEDEVTRDSLVSEIDYVEIDKVLAIEREKSWSWLVNALGLDQVSIGREGLTFQEMLDDGEFIQTERIVDLLLRNGNSDDDKVAFNICKEKVVKIPKLAGKLASMYKDGIGTEPDEAEFMRYLRIAADNGSEWATIELVGVLMRGTPSDREEAFRTCSGKVGRMPRLAGKMAIMYRDGIGTDPDEAEFIRYLRIAADNGSEWAKRVLHSSLS